MIRRNILLLLAHVVGVLLLGAAFWIALIMAHDAYGFQEAPYRGCVVAVSVFRWVMSWLLS